MTCKHCGQPIEACPRSGDRIHFMDCRGWRHTPLTEHSCYGSKEGRQSAEPAVAT